MNEKTKNQPIGIIKSKRHLAMIAAVISAIIIGIGILVALNNSDSSALPETRELFTLYNDYNMTVVVVFDEEPPIVQFIAPDGNYVDMGNIRYRPGSNFIQFFLPNAMPGVWRMNYDPLTNTELTTPYSVYMNHIFIRDFDVVAQRDENGHLPVSFEVSADDDGEFVYVLHAVFTALDNSIASEIVLIGGSGVLNEVHNLAVDTQAIQDMGSFMLRLTASVRHGQASVVDSAWLDLRLSGMSD